MRLYCWPLPLVRAMNSYYSNRIEGQSTHPVHIARALHADFSEQPDIARRQRMALAHIQAEQALAALALGEVESLHSRSLLLAHQLLYEQLPPEDRCTDEGLTMLPGQLRTQDVAVYRHQPPTHSALPLFLARADERYAKPWGLEQLLITAACAHHRLAWVHPFLDGNGRACRLHTHAVMQNLTGGYGQSIAGWPGGGTTTTATCQKPTWRARVIWTGEAAGASAR